MECPKCKKQMPENSTFCDQCGTILIQQKNKTKRLLFWLISAIIVLIIACVLIIVLNKEAKQEVVPRESQETPPTEIPETTQIEQSEENTVTPQKKKELDGAVVFFIQRPDMTDEELANPIPTSWIYFEADCWQVNSEQMKTIDVIAKRMKELPAEYTCQVVGINNYKGSDAYVMKKSEKRAQAVAAVLKEKYGIPSDRIIVVGKGKSVNYGLFE